MKKIFKAPLLALLTLTVIPGCNDKSNEFYTNNSNGSSSSSDSVVYLGGYADPNGVLVLNQGARIVENSSITYISPDGNVEERIYRKVNGTSFGNEAQDLYMYNGKLYILSNNIYSMDDEENDGVLVIVDAVTFKKEKAYKMSELKFKRPEGSLESEEYLSLNTPFDNIAVLDEKNIFISESQGVFRFDSTTGELNIVEGAYHFGNQGNTIEEVASTRGITRVGDCLYCGGGGFWESTRLLEFSKDKNEVTRVMPDLKGEFISGVVQTGDREIMLATCGRGGQTKSYLYFVDLDKWEITKEKQISEDISAEFFNTSGITLMGDYIYYAAGGTKIKRLSLKNWKSEEYINASKDAPMGIYLNCNVVADPVKKYLYIALSDKYSESVIPTNNYLLIYDCSGDSPVLVKNILNNTDYPIGIYPMSKFYKK